jgi:hypothetical protein
MAMPEEKEGYEWWCFALAMHVLPANKAASVSRINWLNK